MTQDSKLVQLSNMWMFSECSKSELAKIGRVADEISVTPSTILCEEGRPGFEFFFILDGRCAVRRRGKKVAILGPGQYFGELSLLDKRPRSATVIAETTCSLLVLGQKEFNSVMADMPRLAHKLLIAMAGRLRASDAKLYN